MQEFNTWMTRNWQLQRKRVFLTTDFTIIDQTNKLQSKLNHLVRHWSTLNELNLTSLFFDAITKETTTVDWQQQDVWQHSTK